MKTWQLGGGYTILFNRNVKLFAVVVTGFLFYSGEPSVTELHL